MGKWESIGVYNTASAEEQNYLQPNAAWCNFCLLIVTWNPPVNTMMLAFVLHCVNDQKSPPGENKERQKALHPTIVRIWSGNDIQSTKMMQLRLSCVSICVFIFKIKTSERCFEWWFSLQHHWHVSHSVSSLLLMQGGLWTWVLCVTLCLHLCCLKQIITIGLPSATVPIPLLDCIEPQMTRCFITIMALELSSIGRCVSLSADCCHDRE